MSGFENEIKDSGIQREEYLISCIRSECAKDYVLPDYMGDVRKLLKCSASVTPGGSYVLDGELCFSYSVTFRTLYLDDEGVLTEATFSQDTECTERTEPRFREADVDSRIMNLSVRLGGPRKISARASLVSDVSLSGERDIMPRCSTDGVEQMKKCISVHSAEYFKTEEREYAEELDKIPDLSRDDVEIVKSEATGFIDAVRKTENGVNLSGFIDAMALIRADEELIRLERRIPVEENVEISLTDSDGVFYPRCIVTDCAVNVNDASGESAEDLFVSVVANVSAECVLAYDHSEEKTVIADAFAIGCENSATYKTVKYKELVGGALEKRKISFTEQRGEERIASLVDREAVLKNVKLEWAEDSVELCADMEVTLVARTDNDDVFSKRYEKPIRERVRINGADGSCKFRSRAVPCEISLSFDSERIYTEVTLLLYCLAERERDVTCLDTLEESKKESSSDRTVTVYYPDKDETVWSVAKKYAVSPIGLAVRNKIALGENMDERLEIDKLLIENN